MAKKPRAPNDDPQTYSDETEQANADLANGQTTPPAEDPPPTQDELDQDKAPLARDQAEQLLRAGHRLRIKGDDPANWVTMTRHAGDLCIAYPALPEALDELLGRGDLILADA